MEQADIETQESVIRVVSPTDVQFKLDDQDKEEVFEIVLLWLCDYDSYGI